MGHKYKVGEKVLVQSGRLGEQTGTVTSILSSKNCLYNFFVKLDNKHLHTTYAKDLDTVNKSLKKGKDTAGLLWYIIQSLEPTVAKEESVDRRLGSTRRAFTPIIPIGTLKAGEVLTEDLEIVKALTKIQNENTPRILLYDIETSMSIVKTFQYWNVNINHTALLRDWYIISAAWKFLGEDKVFSTQCTHAGLKKGNDKNVVQALCKAINSADIIIGHNGDKFDLKKLRARIIKHDLPPVTNVRTIDTLKVAKKEFAFSYNNLDYLGKFLGVGNKLETKTGLWDRVMEGDMEALTQMVEYNKQDVRLLEKVYLKMRPHMSNHPNINVIAGKVLKEDCPACGSSNTSKNGRRPYMKLKKVFQKRKCWDCAHSFLDSKPIGE